MVDCIWRVDIADRRCEYCSFFGGCERREAPASANARAGLYVATMSSIMGHDIKNRRRHRLDVWARNIVAYQLRKEGMSFKEAGDALGLDHSTVIHGCEQVESMLAMPKMYPAEFALWENFKNLLNSQKI